MKLKHILVLALYVLLPQAVLAQEKGTGPREKSIKMEMKSNRQMRIEKRELRRRERAEKKAIKAHHKRLQTKKVRKRMKESRRSATRYNEHKRESFLRRWFKKKG